VLVAVLSSADFSASWWSPGCSPATSSTGSGIGAAPLAPQTVNSLARIVYSMSGPHEARLDGVPLSWSWATTPVVDDPTDASGYPAATAWGQVYALANESEPSEGTVRVELKNMELYVWSKMQRAWVQVQASAQVYGAHFGETFANNFSFDAQWRAEPDGGVSTTLPNGFNLHFWPTGDRGSVAPSDVGAVYVTYAARLIGPNTAAARYLANAGADWWLTTTAPWPDEVGAGEGRFMHLSTSWQAFDFYTGGPYGPASSPPRWNAFGLAISDPPVDAMGRP
jgi:hypothetical protein